MMIFIYFFQKGIVSVFPSNYYNQMHPLFLTYID